MNSIEDLLKQATQFKKSGQIDEAIKTLENAYLLMKDAEISYAFSNYLRLPKYLLIAGQNDRAWSVLNEMLVNGISGSKPSKDMIFMEQYLIFDCMSKQLEKEGKLYEAGIHAAVSYLSRIKALLSQDRVYDIPQNHNFSYIDKCLKKEKKEHLAPSIKSVLTDALVKIKEIKLSDVMRNLRSLNQN